MVVNNTEAPLNTVKLLLLTLVLTIGPAWASPASDESAIGDDAADRGMYDTALFFYNKALQLNPAYAPAITGRANALKHLKGGGSAKNESKKEKNRLQTDEQTNAKSKADQVKQAAAAKEAAAKQKAAKDAAAKQKLAKETAAKQQAAKQQASKDAAAKLQAAKDAAAKQQAAKTAAAKQQAAKEAAAKQQAAKEVAAKQQAVKEAAARQQAAKQQAARDAAAKDAAEKQNAAQEAAAKQKAPQDALAARTQAATSIPAAQLRPATSQYHAPTHVVSSKALGWWEAFVAQAIAGEQSAPSWLIISTCVNFAVMMVLTVWWLSPALTTSKQMKSRLKR